MVHNGGDVIVVQDCLERGHGRGVRHPADCRTLFAIQDRDDVFGRIPGSNDWVAR
jgi:hypothetical protein